MIVLGERVLVTGGAGFIGSHTVDLLMKNGFDVRILDNLENQIHSNKKPDYVNPSVEFLLGDILDIDVWHKALKGTTSIIHLAALTGIGQSMYQPSRYSLTNMVGTAKLYEALVNNPEISRNIRRIIVASSKTVYGEGSYKCINHGPFHPKPRLDEQLQNQDWDVHCPLCGENAQPIGIKEEKPAQNLSIYALSKFSTETLALIYGNLLGIPTTVFRYFSGYGPRQSLNNPYTGVCSIFLCRVRNNKPPIVYEDGKQTRDFVFVKDIARANLLALKKATRTDIYNIGTGCPLSILAIAETIRDILGVNIDPIVTQQYRAGDTRHDFADITKAQKELGFNPEWSFKEGLEELIKWGETHEAIDRFDHANGERLTLSGRS